MSKRKQSNNEDSDGGSSDISMIDVDFDFFNPNPNVDYQAIKRLLRQLLQEDAELFNLHELTELILSQPTIGTTIKTDGEDSDPYALLTVLNMHAHREHSSIIALANYFLKKSSSNSEFHSTLQTLFSQTQNHVGLIICERLINMPVQVIPHMYRMLAEELKNAIVENSAFSFTHLIILSRTYHLSLDDEAKLANSQSRNASSKRKKAKASNVDIPRPDDGIYSFHPEDDCIKEASTFIVDYPFDTATTEPRDKESFGLDTRGRMMLVPADKFEGLVTKLGEVYAVN